MEFKHLEKLVEEVNVYLGETSSETYKQNKIQDNARLLKKVKSIREDLEKLKTSLFPIEKYLSYEVIPEQLEDFGLDSVKITGLGNVFTETSYFVTPIKEKQEEIKEFLFENGKGELIKESINTISLKSAILRLQEEGKEIPKELFKLTPYTKTKIRKN